MRALALTTLAVCLASCLRAPAERPAEGFAVRHKPPERKDIIEAVLASHDVPLSVHSSCSDVGTTPGDATIGAYLSGFLAAQDKPSGNNWLETKVTPEKDAAGSDIWRSELTVRHSAGEDEWGWGVRFDIRRSDGRVVRESFVCIGS